MSDTAQLETQIAFLEDAVSALDSALASQQQQILQLEFALEVMRQRLSEQGARLDAVGDTRAEPPPPHY